MHLVDMGINLLGSRSDIFAKPTMADIKKNTGISRGGSVLTWMDLDNVVFATKNKTIDPGLDNSNNLDGHKALQSLHALKKNELLVFPPQYRIPGGDDIDHQQSIAWGFDDLVYFDGVDVQRQFGISSPERFLSIEERIAHQWLPEKVFSSTFKAIKENGDYLKRRVAAYTNTPSTGRKIWSLERNFEGGELRVFQNYVSFKLLEKRLRHLSKNNDSYAGLKEKFERYRPYFEDKTTHKVINRLHVNKMDLIEMIHEFDNYRGIDMRAPSRSKDFKTYDISFINVPALDKREDPKQLAYLAWELEVIPSTPDARYRTRRRRGNTGVVRKHETFFDSHTVAAYHGVMSILSSKQEFHTPPSLMVMPKKSYASLREKLIQQSLVLDFNEDTNRLSASPLNMAERESIQWSYIAEYGYENCLTTNTRSRKKLGGDPHIYMVNDL